MPKTFIMWSSFQLRSPGLIDFDPSRLNSNSSLKPDNQILNYRYFM